MIAYTMVLSMFVSMTPVLVMVFCPTTVRPVVSTAIAHSSSAKFHVTAEPERKTLILIKILLTAVVRASQNETFENISLF